MGAQQFYAEFRVFLAQGRKNLTMFLLSLDIVVELDARATHLSHKQRDVRSNVELLEAAISGSGEQQLMKTKVSFVGAGEVILFQEIGVVLACLFDLSKLVFISTLARQFEGGGFNNLTHFAYLPDFGGGQFIGKEPASFAGANNPLWMQTFLMPVFAIFS